MSIRPILAATIIVTAALSFTPASHLTAQASNYCQPAISATSAAFRKKSRALKSAKRTWQRSARKKFGRRYNKWTNGNNRRATCKTTGRQHYCTVTASACPKRPFPQRLIPTGTVSTTELG